MDKKKMVLFFGDSITENGGASSAEKCYVSLIDKSPCFKSLQAGYGGSRFTRCHNVSPTHRFDVDFNLRVCILPTKADLVVVFGGTNDYGAGVLLGEVGKKDYYTFAGALSYLIESLSERYGKDKLRFVLPIKRYNCDKPATANGYPLIDYVNKEKEVLEYYKIPYLDMFTDGIPSPDTEEESEYFADGLHPSDKGHQYLAEHILKFLKDTENK